MKLKIRPLAGPTASLQKKILACTFQTVLGFLFSRIVLSRGVLPFGVAYAANSGPFGLAGAIAGYIAGGRDVMRYVIAAVVAGCAKYLLGSIMDIDRGVTCFLFSVWGTMLGGLAGFFFSDYTFSENLRFMLSGLISGLFAYLFSVASEAASDHPRGPAALRYVCFTASCAAALLGVASCGRVGAAAAQILTFFLLLAIGFRCTLTLSVTSAVLVGLFFCLYSREYAYFAAILVLGGFLSGLLKDMGRYAVLSCYAGSVLVLAFYFNDLPRMLTLLFSLLLAGVVWLTLPNRLTDRMLRALLPVRRRNGPRFRRRTGIRKYIYKKKLLRRSAEGDDYTRVCETCRKRLLCWTKNYDRTLESFRQLQEQRTAEPGGFFEKECIHKDRVLRCFRGLELPGGEYRVICARAFAQKQGEEQCGDTAGGFRTEDHRYIMSIADGMGTGRAAAGQSARTARLLRSLTEHGLTEEEILRLVNRELVNDREETVLGMDIAAVDLLTGQCELFKAGAAPSYILREGHVYEIGSSSLPVGILEETDIDHETCRLRENDYLILISDGVLGEDGKWLGEFLNRHGSEVTDCVALANRILGEAKKEGRHVRDDVTVLAAQLKRAA